MAAEQSMTQAIMQAAIEATKAAIMAVRGADNLVNNARSIDTMPILHSQALRQPMIEWKGIDNIKNCLISKQRQNIFMTNT